MRARECAENIKYGCLMPLFSPVFLRTRREKCTFAHLLCELMKKFYLLLCFWCIVGALLAVPAQRILRQVRLADGSVVEAMLLGDEHFAWYETIDGRILEETEAGYVVAAETPDGVRHRARQVLRAGVRHLGSQASAPLPSIGSPRIPVILVEFQDSVFHVGQTEEEQKNFFDLFCNGTRNGNLYKDHGSYGAIRDYFSDQSRGQFTPDFVVLGTVKLDKPESEYGKHNGNNKDVNFPGFCRDAITKAMDKFSDIEWMQFNNRGRNQVDMVFLVFAGCGEANGGHDDTLWPKWSPLNMTIGGVTFRSALCGNEMHLAPSNKTYNGVRPEGIGILCHEMNHALGLPDFYDVNYKNFGMDLWSIMDYGQYAGAGYQPIGMNAYEREFMGWETMEKLTQSGWLTLEPTATTGKGYKIVNAENPDEYYIIENRQPVGWDEAACNFGHGLQVTHVDFDSNRWSNNSVNTDGNHQRMTIIAANNRYIGTCVTSATAADLIKTWNGNCYPFETNDSLTANSVPAATVFTAAGFMHKDLNSIRENDDKTVTLYFGNDFTVGVSEVASEMPARSQSVFDLAGRRVLGAPRSGLYIVDGRKVAIP